MFKRNNEDHWIPLSDLMTGMMLVFLVITAGLLIRMKMMVVAYKNTKTELYQELEHQFHNDFIKWNAKLDSKDLSIKFLQPDILFETGDATLKADFKNTLANFFPRYIKIINQPKYIANLNEIRIEGHTSSFWKNATSAADAYFLNMDLSQRRALATAKFVYNLPMESINTNPTNLSIQTKYQNFLQHYIMVSGLSFSHLVHTKTGAVDESASQRVEFRVELSAEHVLDKISASVK